MPSFNNPSLAKYEDKFFTTGIGHISYFATLGQSQGKARNQKSLAQSVETQISEVVYQSALGLSYRVRTRAPKRTGDLRSGIIASPWAERSATPGKVVYDVCFDAHMNNTFVKFSKKNKRYYYPASQEYGFRIWGGRRQPGLYFMRDTSVEYFGEHEQKVAAGVDRILEDL